MFESDIRRDHTIKLIERWDPEEEIEVDEIVIKRLVTFSNFSRYYLGLKGGNKPCEWVYFTNETLNVIKKISSRHINRD